MNVEFSSRPTALFCSVLLRTTRAAEADGDDWRVKLGLVCAPYPGILAGLRGLDSSGWVPWAKGPCVTWLTAYLSPLLHRPPTVSVCFSVRRRRLGPKSHTVLVPITRSSVSFLIAFHLYISRLDNRMPMSDCKSGRTVINAWRLAPTVFLILEGWDHHGILYVDLSPKGTLGDSQVFLCWNK